MCVLIVVAQAMVTDEEKQKDVLAYVQGLLDLKDKYDKLLQQAFSSDKTFQHTINQVLCRIRID